MPLFETENEANRFAYAFSEIDPDVCSNLGHNYFLKTSPIYKVYYYDKPLKENEKIAISKEEQKPTAPIISFFRVPRNSLRVIAGKHVFLEGENLLDGGYQEFNSSLSP